MATPSGSSPASRLLRSFLLCAVLVGISLAFVDRPVSSWSFHTFHGVALFKYFTYLVVPIMPLALIGLAIAGIAATSGWRPGPGARTGIACCISAAIAFAAKEQLKYLFGRTWPETFVFNNPSWISNGAFGFHPFHGGTGWESFPSGHMTMITSVVAVLWNRVRSLRPLWAALFALVAAGLLGADYHFVSDMVAGVFVGLACAAGVLHFAE